MKIVTWNINGVKARLETAVAWLTLHNPDVVCLQEVKSVDEGFPAETFEALGYTVRTHGQKGFNGVALLSKPPIEDVICGLPGDPDDPQARYIEASVIGQAAAIRLGCLYLPNGNPIGTDKFAYKLAWMERLDQHARRLLELNMPVVLAGDYNIIPMPADAKRPDAWTGDALFQPESRSAYRRLIHQGWTDATRACHPGPGIFTFWDYQAGAFPKDDGIRIDHLLLSPQATDRLVASGIEKQARAMEKPSDHTPVWATLSLT